MQKKIKKPKTKTKDDFILDNTFEAADKMESASAEMLSYDTIQDGMNIMGLIKNVDALYLTVSLPGRIEARVSALEISDSYTKSTKEFLKSEGNSSSDFKPLKELFQTGQVVYGKVQEIVKKAKGGTKINFSLKPATVHSELHHTLIKKGFIFCGAIEEVQEHGYIIESGIKGLRTFVPLQKSAAGHVTGELIYLKVEKITADAAASTCICKELKASDAKIKKVIDGNIDYIMPSTIVHFTVSKRLKDGLKGTIMNDTVAYVNEHHLAEQLALPEDYEAKTQLEARVLYVMPLTKLVYLSLNLYQDSINQEPAYKRGDVVENAKVHHLGTGGVVLVLDNKYKGVISYKTIKSYYKGNYDQDEVLTKYAKKSTHKIRILYYDAMDSMYICTDKENIVNETVFDMNDLQPGQFVEATVKTQRREFGGYSLQIGKVKGKFCYFFIIFKYFIVYSIGIIEKLYLAPTSKQLEPKTKIRCRVVATNPERRTAYLTNRPEYMSKNSKILANLSNLRINASYLGTIVKCDANYLLVKFFNDIKGVLFASSLNTFMSPQLDSFYVGQTMQFRIVSKKDDQISLGLPDDTFAMGEICPVTVMHGLDSGLEIKISIDVDETAEEEGSGNEIKGLVPIRLLSDYMDLLHAKMKTYPMNTQTEVVCMGKNIFSLRDVEYFRTNLTKTWQTVQPGDILKAYVKDVQDDVVELMLPISNYTKLVKVHLKMLLMTAYHNANVVLAPEQVVYVKVLSKEPVTKTLAISAKLTDVWDGQMTSTAEYMQR